MKHTSSRWRRRRGILTLEWMLLMILFGVGLIGGVAALRSVLISEYCGLVQCIEQVNVCDCAKCAATSNPFCVESGAHVCPGP